MDISTDKVAISSIQPVDVPTKLTTVVPPTPTKNELDQSDSVEAQVENKDSKPESAQNLLDAVSQINDYVQNLQRSLLFTVDEESGKDVVTVLDSETENVIRQYPSEEVLKIARRLAADEGDELSLFSTRI